jgi:hypothetical protein
MSTFVVDHLLGSLAHTLGSPDMELAPFEAPLFEELERQLEPVLSTAVIEKQKGVIEVLGKSFR